MARLGAKFTEGMQLCRPGRPKEIVPCVGTEAHHTGKLAFQITKFHRPQQPAEICAEGSQSSAILQARLKGHHEEDRGRGQRRGYWRREGGKVATGWGALVGSGSIGGRLAACADS